MKKYRISYQPFAQSDMLCTDIVLYAKDEQDAQDKFENQYPSWNFVKAEQTL